MEILPFARAVEDRLTGVLSAQEMSTLLDIMERLPPRPRPGPSRAAAPRHEPAARTVPKGRTRWNSQIVTERPQQVRGPPLAGKAAQIRCSTDQNDRDHVLSAS